MDAKELVRRFAVVRLALGLQFATKMVEGIKNLQEQMSALMKARAHALSELDKDCSMHRFEVQPGRVTQLAVTDWQLTSEGNNTRREYLVASETYQELRQGVIGEYDPQIVELCKRRKVLEQAMLKDLAHFSPLFDQVLGEGSAPLVREFLEKSGTTLDESGSSL